MTRPYLRKVPPNCLPTQRYARVNGQLVARETPAGFPFQSVGARTILALSPSTTQEHFRDSLEKSIAMSSIRPEVAVHDLHPQFFGGATIAPLGLKMMAVQHHHAHIASSLAEHHDRTCHRNRIRRRRLRQDRSIWGGEAIVAAFRDFCRLSHVVVRPVGRYRRFCRREVQFSAGSLTESAELEVGCANDGGLALGHADCHISIMSSRP